MTRNEAIDVLKANYPDVCFSELREAVDVAIKALSARWHKYPDEKPPRSDVYLVSEYSCLTKKITFVWVCYWDGEMWHFAENFENPDYTDIGNWIYAWMELPEAMKTQKRGENQWMI